LVSGGAQQRFLHCGSRFAAGNVNAEEPSPTGTACQRIVRSSDSTPSEPSRLDADESLVCDDDDDGDSSTRSWNSVEP
jgi:hypothetical protein